MTDIIKIEKFDETTIKDIADDICLPVISGDETGLPKYIQAKALEKLSKLIIDKIGDFAIDEAQGYSAVDSVFNGASFNLSTTGNTLDYSDDQEYSDIEKALKKRKDQLKTAFDLYRKDGSRVTDTVTGEEISIVPVKKESEQIIKVSFKG